MLTDEQIEKYRAIYKKHFGKEIGKAEALEQGTKLINLIEAVYKLMTKKEFEELQRRRKEIEK
jgi:protein-arginine kinase activator protein McsA